MIKKIFTTLFLIILMSGKVYSTTFTGEVSKVGLQESNQVVDSVTKQGIEFAKISIPQTNFKAYTDANGNFELPMIQIKDNQPLMLNVEKEGYRPFSITINSNQSLSNPFHIEIARSEPADISLDTGIFHLGDNSYSKNSANAGDFRLKSIGPYYSKDFIMTKNAKQSTNYLIIGSIVGIDTKLARQMGQNRIKTAYSSPVEVFFNGQKISEIKINGDGQRIKIPSSLIIPDSRNQITLKTGQNMMPSDHIDYDDIEIMNLSILSE